MLYWRGDRLGRVRSVASALDDPGEPPRRMPTCPSDKTPAAGAARRLCRRAGERPPVPAIDSVVAAQSGVTSSRA
jgi:hypothetical protein